MALDYRNRGKRCRVIGCPRNHNHQFRGVEQGVILAETETGLGQKIMSVEWDGGDFGPLFSEEIEVLNEDRM